MKLYDTNIKTRKCYIAKTHKGIKLDSRNHDWNIDIIKIDNEDVELYSTHSIKFKYFKFNDRWYRIEDNFANMLMPDILYTNSKSTIKNK